MPVPSTNISEFATQGFTMARRLFSLDEAEQLRERFFWINENHQRVSDNITDESDPLAKYPRVGQMHRWDETSLNWLIDPRLKKWMTDLLGREPFAAQSMFYFKPPGARSSAASGSILSARRAGRLRRRLDGGRPLRRRKRLSLCRTGDAQHSGSLHSRCRY